MKRRQLLLLAAAVADSTFERTTFDGQTVWVGKCSVGWYLVGGLVAGLVHRLLAKRTM